MSIRALHQVRPMPGRSKPQLMYCENDGLYVVKLSSNSRGSRALVCEFLASKIGRWAGLPIPDCEVIEVDPFLLQSTEELSRVRPEARSADPEATLHCGSRLIGGMDGRVCDILPASYLAALSSHRVFGGMLVFDKFWSKLDDRQAVFHRTAPGSEFTPYFIDHDESFGGAAWKFTASLLDDGIFPSRDVYNHITGLESFEPYLTQCVEGITLDLLWGLCKEIPASWYNHDKTALETLVESLRLQALEVYPSLVSLRAASHNLFPKWHRTAQSCPMPFPSTVPTADLPHTPREA
jgi:hypothetical protein